MRNYHHQSYNNLVTPCIYKYRKRYIVSLIEISTLQLIQCVQTIQIQQIGSRYLNLRIQVNIKIMQQISHDLKNSIFIVQSMITLILDYLFELSEMETNLVAFLKIQSLLQRWVQKIFKFYNNLIKKLKLTRLILCLIQDFQVYFKSDKKKELIIRYFFQLNSLSLNNDPLNIKQINQFQFLMQQNQIKRNNIITFFDDLSKFLYIFLKCQGVNLNQQISSRFQYSIYRSIKVDFLYSF
ncbi:unnamed protein product [Paramecium primaurelia]|uniref:Uncharacterized protein n=1 Tax=Paramecium primaurelia TaxID=5886 RepID=A0A8S1PUE3_PARPR|nr:unnamed protein product [Paramecium primaurelia]